jgi:hypothetical protein
VESDIIGISRTITGRSIAIGRSSAERPSTRPTLAMFEPSMLPKAISELPDRAAERLTASSGALVPKATTVSPTTSGETPMWNASALAPRTRPSPPTTSSSSPTARRNRSPST